MGDAIAANIFMLGYAWQQGLIPLTLSSIENAIELNGVAAASNLRSFFWGRMAAHDMKAVRQLLGTDNKSDTLSPRSLTEIVSHRAAHLSAYQNEALKNIPHWLAGLSKRKKQ